MIKQLAFYLIFLLLIFFSFFLSTDELNAVSPFDYGLKEGDLISAIFSDDPDVYIVNEHGYKRLFLNPEIFKFYKHLGGFTNVKLVTQEVRDSFPTTGLFRNCEDDDKRVFGIDVEGEDIGQLHWVNTTGDQAVKDDSNFFKKVFCINKKEFNWYKKADSFNSVIEVPKYDRLIETATISTKERLESKAETKGIGKVIICHYPPENIQAYQTLTIDASALKAHLDHGDTVGACLSPIPTPTPSASPGPTASPSATPIITTSPSPTSSASFSPTPVPTATTTATPVPTTTTGSVPPPVSSTPTPTPIPTTTPTPTSTYGVPQLTAPTDLIIDKGTTLHLNPPAVNYSVRFNYTLASDTASFRIYLKRPNSITFTPYTYNAQVPLLDPSQWNDSSAAPYLRQTGTSSWYWWSADEFLPNADPSRFGEYKVYVTAVNTAGAESVASQTKTIRIYAPPVISSPSEGSTVSTKPTITFTAGDPSVSGQNYATYIYKANVNGLAVWSNGAATPNFVYPGTELSSNDNPHRLVVHSYDAGATFPYWYSPFSQTTFSVAAPTPTPTTYAPPSSVTATLGTDKIAVTWSGTSLKSMLYRSVNGGGYQLWSTVDGFNYDENKLNLQSGSTYRYKIHSCGNIDFYNCSYSNGTESNSVTYSSSTPTPTPAPSNTATVSFDNFSKDLAITPKINRDLYLGTRGNDVKQLQALLVNEVGYSANLITGYFGRITRDAVKKLQEKYGIRPVSGYFGGITRRALNALISN